MELTLESICEGARRLVGVGPKIYKEPVILKNEPIRVGEQILAVGDIVYMHPKEPQQNGLAALGRMREYRLFYKPSGIQPDTFPDCLVMDMAVHFDFSDCCPSSSGSWTMWPFESPYGDRLCIPGDGSLDNTYNFYIGAEEILKGMEANGNGNVDHVRRVLETFDFVQYSARLMTYDRYPPVKV